jgi:anti-sigma regulatory factor (Ser/Thr protein kinase)
MEIGARVGECAQWSLPMEEASQVFEARGRAERMARELGFSETRIGFVALIITEAGNNLVKHATRGELVVGTVGYGGRLGLQILSLDRGPGMRDIAQCFRDGYSTTGTPGTGLGAIRRLADVFDVYSLPERGTALVAYVWAREAIFESPAPDGLFSAAVCLPKKGESVSGDGWDILAAPGRTRVLITDGLGHGPEAAAASEAAIAAFRTHPSLPPAALLEMLHGALKPTRGAVAAVADVDRRSGTLVFCGIGNISGAIQAPSGSQSLVSMNGTLGHASARAREFSYRWSDDAVLILHSDGLNTRWGFEDYPGLLARHPSLIAGVLYRDFCRGRDDVTVVVARPERP